MKNRFEKTTERIEEDEMNKISALKDLGFLAFSYFSICGILIWVCHKYIEILQKTS